MNKLSLRKIFKLSLSNLNLVKYHDKLLHFLAGYQIAFMTYLIIYHIYHIHLKSLLFALLASATASIAKEIYDYIDYKNHTPDINDAVITIIGAIISFLQIALLYAEFVK